MTFDLTDPAFHDESKAREWLEHSRWSGQPACCHCGSLSVLRLQGKAHRAGLFHCRDCRGQFTVLTGSVMERSHIPLCKWVLAIRLMTASKKGISAHQLHRMLNMGYKSAWFMCHRIREGMRKPRPAPLGGEGKIVEADEAYHGKRETPRVRNKYSPPPTKRGKGGGAEKRPIVALVERVGEVRATHMNQVTGKNLRDFVVRNASRKSRLHTDESRLYDAIGAEFAKHETVHHAVGEYARDDVTTNTVEGFFGMFERGMTGVTSTAASSTCNATRTSSASATTPCSLGRPRRRTRLLAAKGMDGKRLTYRRTSEAEDAAPGG